MTRASAAAPAGMADVNLGSPTQRPRARGEDSASLRLSAMKTAERADTGLALAALESALLRPWWRLHCDLPVPLMGNTMHRLWAPRQGMPLYAFALVACCLGLGAALRSASRAAGLPRLTPFARALLLVVPPVVPAATAGGAAAEEDEAATTAAALFFFVLLNLGFAYVNFVTTCRPSLFRGKHGGFRDVALVNLGLPLLLRLAVLAPGVHRELFLAGGDGALGPGLAWFLLSYLGGLHMTYVTRTGLFAQSISAVDLRDPSSSRWSAVAQLAFKLLFIVGNIGLHLAWLARAGNGLLLSRGILYASFVLVVAAVTFLSRARYYLHAHHWLMGYILTPLCATTAGPAWSLVLLGFSLSQFVEGAARWSCAPLWHAYPPAAVKAAAVDAKAAADAIAEEEENDPSTPLVPIVPSSSSLSSSPRVRNGGLPASRGGRGGGGGEAGGGAGRRGGSNG